MKLCAAYAHVLKTARKSLMARKNAPPARVSFSHIDSIIMQSHGVGTSLDRSRSGIECRRGQREKCRSLTIR